MGKNNNKKEYIYENILNLQHLFFQQSLHTPIL